jgi:hypothetical protein
MVATTTISKDLRKKLESLVSPAKTADELANEIIAAYIRQQEKERDWLDLVNFGLKNGADSHYTEADVVDLVLQTRKR